MELTLEEAALALAQKKRVEARPKFRVGGQWNSISPIGSKESSSWPASILNEAEVYDFRLAPEPPAKKFLPLTVEEWEGRLGATVRRKGAPREVRLVGSCVDGVITIAGGGQFTPLAILDVWEFGDGSPCGVEVDA